MIGGIIFLICMLGFYGVVKGEPDRLMGAYMTCKGKIWIITEWDRSSTIILFPDEY